MRRIAAYFAIIQLVLLGSPALAQAGAEAGMQLGSNAYGSVRTVSTESWIEEWDPATGQWVKVADGDATSRGPQPIVPTITTTLVNGEVVSETHTAARYARPAAVRGSAAMLAQYGPFVVTSAQTAAIVSSTDSASPAQFDAMLRDFPQIAVLEMVEAPGTSNDIANLAVGRRIRDAGIATHVPMGGSVRSGAVELFLAGATRTMDDGAQFAVHSWLDNHGREADDFAADHPANRMYLDYYVEMGMSEARAREFYAMTNSVPHSSALWLGAADMRPWLKQERATFERMPDRVFATAPLLVVSEGRIPTVQIDWDRMENSPVFPMIHYGDLSAITLARLDLSQLDSVYAFP